MVLASASVFKSKQNVFSSTMIQFFTLVKKINKSWGELTDISAKKKALMLATYPRACVLEGCCHPIRQGEWSKALCFYIQKTRQSQCMCYYFFGSLQAPGLGMYSEVLNVYWHYK